jgi:alkylation response protein AidB-like acyl-CoA dehydrogenase
MSSIVAPSTRERIYGGTSEIMKTIIARDLTGLRA